MRVRVSPAPPRSPGPERQSGPVRITVEDPPTWSRVTASRPRSGPREALRHRPGRAAARLGVRDRDVAIPGAATINQYLRGGLIDELRTHIAPVTLGAGERLFEGVPALDLKLVSARPASLLTTSPAWFAAEPAVAGMSGGPTGSTGTRIRLHRATKA
ncbi:dihydrofolate reductase family protein [Saccharopolyspora hattusasensis]|uniref:dihydrofolate reductase family protein n=1 Tax=Saccharopolyspora hattusasensis TaxID=1128679 RepID=UPI003D972EE5